MSTNFKLKIRVQDVLSTTCSDANLTLLGQDLIVNKSSLDPARQIEKEDVISKFINDFY
jgi:hypothetical protein